MPTSVSTTANDCKTRWYTEKIHTDIVATNISDRWHMTVPRLHKNEWVNWRKQAFVANSQAIMVGCKIKLPSSCQTDGILRELEIVMKCEKSKNCFNLRFYVMHSQ